MKVPKIRFTYYAMALIGSIVFGLLSYLYWASFSIDSNDDRKNQPAVSLDRVPQSSSGFSNSSRIRVMPKNLEAQIYAFRHNKIQGNEKIGNLLEKAWADISNCFEIIDANEVPSKAEKIKADILVMLAAVDIKLLSEGLSLLKNDNEKKKVIIAVIPEAAKNEPVELMEYAKSFFKQDEIERAMLACIDKFSQNGSIRDANSALELLQTPLARLTAIDIVSSSIAKQNDNIGIAIDWIQKLANPEERQRAELAILGVRAKNADMAGLVQMMNVFHEPKTIIAAASLVIERLSIDNNDASIEWTSSLPPEVSAQLGGRLAVAMAKNDLPMATRYTLELADSTQRYFAIDGIARNLYKQSPAILAEWGKSLPEMYSERVTSLLVSSWMKDDSQQAREWIFNLPDGDARERALASAAGGLGLDASKARELLVMIKDPKIRALAQKDVDMNLELLNKK